MNTRRSLGVGFALSLAGGESGTRQAVLVGVAVLTVMLSWTVANTLYTLRYAHLYIALADAGITFGASAADVRPPTATSRTSPSPSG